MEEGEKCKQRQRTRGVGACRRAVISGSQGLCYAERVTPSHTTCEAHHEREFPHDAQRHKAKARLGASPLHRHLPAGDVFPQSFNLDDVRHWIDNSPEFADQAVYLDDRYDDETFDHRDPASWSPSMEELAKQGVKILAPPMWMLLEARPKAGENEERIVPSAYAERAKAAGLELIAWSFERSGPLTEDGEWYHRSIRQRGRQAAGAGRADPGCGHHGPVLGLAGDRDPLR